MPDLTLGSKKLRNFLRRTSPAALSIYAAPETSPESGGPFCGPFGTALVPVRRGSILTLRRWSRLMSSPRAMPIC